MASPTAVTGMTLKDGALSGEGADLLLSHIPNAQFVMIGEDHGFADSSAIALALSKAGRPHGLTHHVVEIGPITEQLVCEYLTEGDSHTLSALLAGRPLSIPFINLEHDAELADYFIDNATAGQDALWGVDQEFIGSPLLHLETLLELAPDSSTKRLVSELLDAEQMAFSASNQGAVFMFTAPPETFEKLRTAFADVTVAAEIIEALETSASMYQLYGAGKNFSSNTDRVDYIRTQFLAAYRGASDPAPRALFKFGAIHMARGTTFLNTFDLGSLTEGIAAANGLDVLRIAILPLEGQQTVIRPSPDGAFQTKEMRSDQVAVLLQLIGVEQETIPEDGYAVIALDAVRRKLEQDGLDELPSQTKFFILGYDYLVTTRGAQAAAPLALK